MARKMLIVHGYSDGSGSFTDLGNFFVERGKYRESDIYYTDYSSMDDDATFRDFADKLDEDYDRLFGEERIDVACHSTGSLVVRAWLAMRFERRTSATTRSPSRSSPASTTAASCIPRNRRRTRSASWRRTVREPWPSKL